MTGDIILWRSFLSLFGASPREAVDGHTEQLRQAIQALNDEATRDGFVLESVAISYGTWHLAGVSWTATTVCGRALRKPSEAA